MCAGQNGFGPLTRATQNSSILTGGSSGAGVYTLVSAISDPNRPEITRPQERDAAWAEARSNPMPSELLDRLELGEPVIVDRLQLGIGGNSLPLPSDAPACTTDFRNLHRIRVRIDDGIAPVYDD